MGRFAPVSVLVALALLAPPAPAVADPAEDGLFAPYTATRVGRSWPETVAVGDVTGDGRPDAVLATVSYDDPAIDYTLSVYAQRADGALADPVRYATALGWADRDGAGIAVLDTNDDGRLDVALGTDRGVQVFRQTAAGTLVEAGLVAGSEHAAGVTATDMDGDGDTDLVAGGYHGSTLLTQAGGWFTAARVTTDPTTEVGAGDLDGDGLGDVVTVYGWRFAVHHRTADGWRRSAHELAHVQRSNVPDGLEVADVTGDGRADLVFALSGNLPDGRLNVFAQTPAGGLAAPVTYLTPDMPGPVAAADVNGDGRTDVVTVHNGWMLLEALVQAPDGALGSRAFAPLPYATSYNPQALALGDVTGDGRVDAVIADYNSGLVVVRNAGGPAPAPDAHVWVTSTSPADGAVGVPTSVRPQIVVRHRLNPESIGDNTVFMEDAADEPVGTEYAYDPATGTITLTPHEPLQPGTKYTLVVGRVVAANGARSQVPAVYTFTTASQPAR